MKTKYLQTIFTVLALMLAANLLAQYAADSTKNYYFYTGKMDVYYDSIKENTPDTVKIPGYNDYERYKEFWNTRVYNCDTATGDYSKYVEQLKLYSQNPAMAPTATTSNTWNFVGPKNLSSHNQGIIVSLYIDPNNINNVLAGTNNSGLFRTTNGGQTWENVTDIIGLPGLGVNDIAVNPNNFSEIYIATGNSFNNYGMGIFKTSDNCNSWQQVLSFDPNDRMLTRKLLIDNENPSIIYALVNKYVYRTKNGGSSWEMIFDQLTIPNWWDKNKYLIDIEFKPNDHNTVYISSVSIKTNENPSHEYSAEIWKTHNAKATNVTWQRIENGLPDYVERYALETDPQNPDKLYIGYTVPGSWDNYNSFYLKEADYPNYTVQEKYHKLNIYNGYYGADLGGLGFWRFEIEISPINPDIMFIGGWYLDVLNLATNQIIKSHHVTSMSNPAFHVDQRIFKTSVSNGKTYLFCGNDGGVSKYNYTDDIMESINGSGLDNLQYFGIGDCEAMPEFFIGGTQDNGEIGSYTGSWFRTNVGDSYENIIDPVAPNIVYCTSNGGIKSVVKSTDYGSTFLSKNTGIPPQIRKDSGLNDRPFVMSPQDRNTLYIGYHEVYKTTDGGDNWQQFTHFHDNGYVVNNAIKAIGLTSATPNIMYVGYNGATWTASGKSRLFKTNDGGATWTDLTTGIIADIVHYNGITDIKVSDLNPTDLWVSFAGFQENNGNAINKVLHSGNAGSSWTDITANLPNLPVNRLQKIVIDNTCYIIAGNDIGVFLYDSQQASWINISNGLPPVSVSDIEINYAKAEMRIATFGRGIWKSKFPCTLPGSDIHINVSQVWNRDKVLSNSLHVESGKTLEIKSNISLTSDAKIIVKPGAKLILNGGTLTNACGDAWQGIEVWGNTNMHQYDDDNGNNAQGKLILKNGAIIENAWNAVTNWKPGDWDTRGGIIIATDAHFINNKRSVEFMKYQNFDPATGTPTQYISRFKNCEFVYNDDNHISTLPYDHVTMWGVNGVTFKGCTFINEVTAKPNTGSGIYSLDAGYTVANFCNEPAINCPGGGVRSAFNGFESGIESSNPNIPDYQISIFNSDFIDNGTGIILSSVLAPVIVNDTFELGAIDDDCGNKVGIGIQLDNTKMFAVENNHFKLPQTPPPADYYGILTINTNNDYDEIYRNTFYGIIVANRAKGKNWNTYVWTGLSYYCNGNQNNVWDFDVEKDHSDNGIQLNQGSRDYATGNTFSTNAYSHFYNNGDYELNYYYDNGTSSQIPTLLYRVTPKPLQLSNSCPSHYGNDVRLTATEYQQHETDYNNAESSYDNAVTNYDAASDSATRSYWSDKMSYYNRQKSRAAYDIIRSDLADTVAHPGLFKSWMEKLNTYASAEAMVDYYLQQGDYSTALNKVDSLPVNFTFTDYDSIEYPLYKDFKTMQAEWMAGGRNIFQLTDSEVNSLIFIADSSKGTAGAQARGILLFAYDSLYSYSLCPQLPDTSLKSAEFGSNSINNEGDDKLTVNAKPNPANNTVTFSYALPAGVEKAVLRLFNANGSLVDKRILNNASCELQYNCSYLKPGIYYYKVSSGKETVSHKLVIVK